MTNYGFGMPPEPQAWLTYLVAAVYIGFFLAVFRKAKLAYSTLSAVLFAIIAAWAGASFISVLAFISSYFIHNEPVEMLLSAFAASMAAIALSLLGALGSSVARVIRHRR